jgi:hypothetical protein
MPRKDPEAYKKYQADLMRQRRAQAKASKPAVDNLPMAADDPASDIPGQQAPTVLAKITQPAPASQPEVSKGNLSDTKVTSTVVKSPALSTPQSRAEKVAARTRELLDTRGWCIWRCSALNNEKIMILRDESVTDAPIGYPIYLEKELEVIGDMNDWSIRIVHKAKKLAGARLL